MQRCPLELLRQVVCHVEPEGGNDSLKALSLSCRALAPLAQEAIFRVIDFADAVEATYEKLLELVSSNPALGAYARKLVFDGSQVDDIGLILTRMSELGVAPHFAQVTELALNYWTFSDRDTQDFLRCFSQFKSVRSLVFERCRFMNVDDMHTRVGCFQASLQDLALKSLGFRTVIQDTVGTVGTVQNIVERSWLLPSFCMIAVHVPTVVAWCLQNIVPSSLLSLTIKISYFKDAEATSLLFSQCTALRYLSVETDISQWVELRTGVHLLDLKNMHELRSLRINVLSKFNWFLLQAMLASLPERSSLEIVDATECWVTDCTIWDTFWAEVLSALDSQLSAEKFGRLRELNMGMVYHKRGSDMKALADVMPLVARRGVLYFEEYDM